MISRELRDAIIAFEISIRAQRCLGDRLTRRAERAARVARTRRRMMQVAARELYAQHAEIQS